MSFWFMVDTSNSNERSRNYGWLHNSLAAAKKQYDEHRTNPNFSSLTLPKRIKVGSRPTKNVFFPDPDDFSSSEAYFNAVKTLWVLREEGTNYVLWFETKELAEAYATNHGMENVNIELFVRDIASK